MMRDCEICNEEFEVDPEFPGATVCDDCDEEFGEEEDEDDDEESSIDDED